ncbi:MAG TPA: hypothetical protein VFG62_19125 [Rhodopila sp.]|nr:hypothetical protein [Rhodopila sp.]
MFVLPLIFLGAATAPSNCDVSPSVSGTVSPTPAAAQASRPAGVNLTTYGYAAIRPPDTGAGCQVQLPQIGNPATLRNETDDVTHGLSRSDALAPVTQPTQAPLFR